MLRLLRRPAFFSFPLVGLLFLYLATHIYHLLALPVFADEAIYIRWAQLITDDVGRYLFFPLLDGKTPLFIWLLVPFQYILADQLWVARIVSVIIGLLQVLVLGGISRSLGLRRSTQLLVMAMTSFLPMWFFYQRMALMDGMLALLLSLSWWAALILSQLPAKSKPRQRLLWAALSGVAFGLALLTKLPALFFLPCFLLIPFIQEMMWPSRRRLALYLAGSVLIGLAFLAFLRVSPSFGQLFHRSQDFTFTFAEMVAGGWKTNLLRFPSHLLSIANQLTWPVFILILIGVFFPSRRKSGVLLLTALGYAAPFLILGKVVYPRYFLPSIPFLTLAAGVSWQAAVDLWVVHQRNLLTKSSSSLLLALGSAFAATTIVLFMILAWWYPSALPLSQADRVQYLEEWSSGFGIPETVAFIQAAEQTHSIAVATEGRFGTLPDGLLLYFHHRNVENLYIEGTGQYPVKSLPDFFTKRARTFDQSILVVNSHRMELPISSDHLLFEVCRPNNAPCLQVWDVTTIVKQSAPKP